MRKLLPTINERNFHESRINIKIKTLDYQQAHHGGGHNGSGLPTQTGYHSGSHEHHQCGGTTYHSAVMTLPDRQTNKVQSIIRKVRTRS